MSDTPITDAVLERCYSGPTVTFAEMVPLARDLERALNDATRYVDWDSPAGARIRTILRKYSTDAQE